MPRLLTKLRIDEVSSVDRGAGEGVRIMLMKRDQALPPEVEIYLKREFSEDKRKELADSGKALPDGSYPIEDVDDLKNAIHAYGRAKDKEAAKAHIIRRAKELGESGLLPEEWTKKSLFAKVLELIVGKAQDFNAAQANTEAYEYAQGVIEEIYEAIGSLQQSICSIACDEALTDKRPALEETLAQFKEHIQGVVPEGIEQAMAAAGLVAAGYTINPQGAIAKGNLDMTEEEKKRKEAEEKARQEREELEKKLAKALHDIAVLKLSTVHKAHYDTLTTDDARNEFVAKSDADRDAVIAQVTKSVALPESVVKALAQAEEDRKVLKALQADKELQGFKKKAVESGLPESMAETMQKAYAGDKAAMDTLVVELGKANNAAQVGGVFKEFGSSQGTTTGTTAYDQLVAKANELRKNDPNLTEAQAFTKVYADPANRELVKNERRENRPA